MHRNKTDFKNKAILRFYKQLPSDVQSHYRSYEDFFDEFREVDLDLVEMHRQHEVRSNFEFPLGQGEAEQTGRA